MTPPQMMDARPGRKASRQRIAQRARLADVVRESSELLTPGEVRELVDRELDEIEAER